MSTRSTIERDLRHSYMMPGVTGLQLAWSKPAAAEFTGCFFKKYRIILRNIVDDGTYSIEGAVGITTIPHTDDPLVYSLATSEHFLPDGY